ncbi:MAG: FUSC family protein [Pseudomonadota bacterium]
MFGRLSSRWHDRDFRKSLQAALRQGLKGLLAAGLAWLAADALHLPQTHWAVISALVVVQGTLGTTLRAGRDRILGTVFGAACGALAGTVYGWGWPMPLLLLAALAPAVLLASWRRSFRTAPIAAMIVVSSLSSHSSALTAALLRVAEISLGAAIGVAVMRWFLHMPTQTRMRLDALHLLEQLRDYAACIGRDPAAATIASEAQAEQRASRIRGYLREAAVIARDARHEGQLVHSHAQDLATSLRRLYDDLALINRVAIQARHRAGSMATLLEQLGPGLQDSLNQELKLLQQGQAISARPALDQLIDGLAEVPAADVAKPAVGELRAVLRYALASLRRQLDAVARLLTPDAGQADK